MKTLSVLGLTILLASTARAADTEPFPGAISNWEGFARHDFRLNGLNVTVVEPKTPLPGRPWAWRGEFFGAFPNADVELVRRGWRLVYVGVPDLFGSPEAVARWDKVYDVLVNRHKLSPKPGLIGLSRGALYCMAWAAAHPDKTLAVYLDNGVCDFKSWPGGRPKGLGTGVGSPEEWTKLLKAYAFKDDHEAITSRLSPVDRLKPLADAKVPILLVYGDSDRTVPHLENSEIVYDRYRALGGPVERIVKPGADHHPHGLTDPKPVVEFFERAWRAERSSSASLTSVEFHLATIDRAPLPDASVDCVISNCVINLAPDKPAVFREIARVLKPGGRLAVSDVALKRELAPELGNDLMAYVGCIAGAIPIEEYHRGLIEAGFAHVEVIDSGSDLNAYAQVENQAACCPPPAPSPSGLAVVNAGCCTVGPAAVVDEALHARLADLLRRYDVNDYAASVKVFAVKP